MFIYMNRRIHILRCKRPISLCLCLYCIYSAIGSQDWRIKLQGAASQDSVLRLICKAIERHTQTIAKISVSTASANARLIRGQTLSYGYRLKLRLRTAVNRKWRHVNNGQH